MVDIRFIDCWCPRKTRSSYRMALPLRRIASLDPAPGVDVHDRKPEHQSNFADASPNVVIRRSQCNRRDETNVSQPTLRRRRSNRRRGAMKAERTIKTPSSVKQNPSKRGYECGKETDQTSQEKVRRTSEAEQTLDQRETPTRKP